ncbi:MAG: RDD family protein [Desulfosudaceae bacterium]
MDWYYVVDKERVGPVKEEDFQSLVQDGTIGPDTLVWTAGMTDWQPYQQAEMSGLTGESSPEARVTCAECGLFFARDDVLAFDNAWVCAACKPRFLQKLKQGQNVSGTMRYAGFWIRAGAVIIDGIILWVVQLILSLPFTLALSSMMSDLDSQQPDFQSMGPIFALQIFLMVLQFGVAIAYETWFIGKYGATLGKMACKIKVVKADGEKVGYGLAFGRYFGKIVSSIILGIGFIMAAFDGQKRALHDHICNTRVIHKE